MPKRRVNKVQSFILEKLKKEDIPGPFTNEDEIKRYLLHQVEDDIKNKHM